MPKLSRRSFVGGAAAASAVGVTILPRRAMAAEFSYKYANNVPTDHPMNVRAREAVARIKDESKGRVEIEIFPNNQLGGDTDMLSQLRSGALECFNLSGLILATLVPVASIYGIAFAFKGPGHRFRRARWRSWKAFARSHREGRHRQLREDMEQ